VTPAIVTRDAETISAATGIMMSEACVKLLTAVLVLIADVCVVITSVVVTVAVDVTVVVPVTVTLAPVALVVLVVVVVMFVVVVVDVVVVLVSCAGAPPIFMVTVTDSVTFGSSMAVPVTVSVALPAGVSFATVTFIFDTPSEYSGTSTGFGSKVTVTPAGAPSAIILTLPSKPSWPVAETEISADPRIGTFCESGVACM